MPDRGQRPRGRPQRLPFDDVAATDTALDGQKRLAWLLTTARVMGATPNRVDFVEKLRAAGIRADSSRISRWESGLEPLPPHLVGAYECAAGVPHMLLTAARRLLYRGGHLPDRLELRPSTAVHTAAELDGLLDQVQRHSMTGAEWLQLSELLSSFEHVYLPVRSWRSMADLLVSELARSIGLAYLRRCEAAISMLRLPIAQPHLSAGIARFALEPGAQLTARVLPALGLLGTGAGDLLVHMVQNQDAQVRAAASRAASSTWLGRRDPLGDTEEPDPDSVQPFVVDLLRTHRTSARSTLTTVTLDLTCRLPEEHFTRALQAVTSRSEQARLLRARETRELVSASTARQISDRIATQAEAALDRQSHDPDLMLRQLLREALFHVHRDRRIIATGLIIASPYSRAVAAATLGHTTHEAPEVACAAWSLTARLAGATDDADLFAAALEERRPAAQMAVMAALAQTRRPLEEALATRVATAAVSDIPGMAPAAVTCLGMHRRMDLMPDATAAPAVREAVRWWRANPGALHEDHVGFTAPAV
ncbi:hypothetical protein [Nocardioides sp.]|uniref:hypothetical protein n=1 Tax=Nocardioides sp. TaxID=35761 RepID=UPI0035191410